MSEWLRRQTRNLLGLSCAGSNPAVDAVFCISSFSFFHLRPNKGKIVFQQSKRPPKREKSKRPFILLRLSQKSLHFFMASSLRFNLTSLYSLYPIPTQRSFTPIRCGPRDNRGPLVKGRILSTEAIQAIQSLKRAYRNSSSTTTNTQLPSLSRLIKSDLLATLRELLRQDQCILALHVLSTVRSEYPPLDLTLYADVATALARNRLADEIDGLIGEMEAMECDDEKALVRLIKGVVGAGRRESTVRICGLMKENGVGSRKRVGEYVVKVLSKGLRRFGEVGLALEVESEFGGSSRVNLDKLRI